MIHVIHDLSSFVPDMVSGLGFHHGLSWSDTLDMSVLAQQVNSDLVKDVQVSFKKFVESGQVWALVIGFILGYLFKNFTTFG